MDTFKDQRDGKVYKTIKIGNQIWMAENLAYKPDNGFFCCYNNDGSYLEKYGYLYDWDTAKKVSPDGWHLPAVEEAEILFNSFDSEEEAFIALKLDGESGFSALFGGYYNSYDKEFMDEGSKALFWTSTEGFNNAKCMGLFSDSMQAYIGGDCVDFGFSVRCLKIS
jgi:uncharacterized protein (TIGR02145 family)